MAEHMLTTVDNPFNPFTEFTDWLAYDEREGYYTLPYLGRIVVTSNDLSEADQSLATELAIDEILNEDLNGIYRKVEKP